MYNSLPYLFFKNLRTIFNESLAKVRWQLVTLLFPSSVVVTQQTLTLLLQVRFLSRVPNKSTLCNLKCGHRTSKGVVAVIVCFYLVTMFKENDMKRSKLQCRSRLPYGLGLARKINLIRQPTRGVMVTYMTLNHRVLSSNLSEWTIWGYNLTAKVAGF